MKRIAITGHSPHILSGDFTLRSPLARAIKEKIIDIIEKEKGEPDERGEVEDIRLISGMASGIDLFAHIASIGNLRIIVAVPFKGHDRKWTERAKGYYDELLQYSNHIVVTDIEPIRRIDYEAFKELPDTPFTVEKMQKRNEWMVDNCDLLIAVWDGSIGDTANCVDYARAKGKSIIVIDPV